MLDERRMTIVKEIHYWKKHKLLPDVYCDYLLALYTQGEPTEPHYSKNKSFTMVEVVSTMLLFLLLLLSFLMVYVFDLIVLWELSLLGVICLFATYLFWFIRRNTTYVYHIGLVALLLMYLIYSIQISLSVFGQPWLVNIMLLLNFFGWLWIGFRKHLKYLTIVSTMSIVFTLFYWISRYFVT